VKGILGGAGMERAAIGFLLVIILLVLLPHLINLFTNLTTIVTPKEPTTLDVQVSVSY